MDVIDSPRLGIIWENLIYFDKTAVMGSRSAPYICQRITTFIRHIMHNLEYFIANYVDDFMGLDCPEQIWRSYQTLKNLLSDLGATEAEHKAVAPTETLEFLGVWFNLKEMTISVMPQRMGELLKELDLWTERKRYQWKQLESLLEKLQFISNCVRLGRLMVFRLRNELRQAEWNWREVNSEMRKDINWWRKFLPTYDRVSIM